MYRMNKKKIEERMKSIEDRIDARIRKYGSIDRAVDEELGGLFPQWYEDKYGNKHSSTVTTTPYAE